jgi:HEAT repeat protein
VSDIVERAIAQLVSEHADEVDDAMGLLRQMPDEAHDAVTAALAEHRGSQPNLALLLGEWGRPESVGVLRDAVERGGHSLRYAASMALATHADPAAGEALADLAGADDRDVAEIAALALREREGRT